jgi:ligand-binding sensor domain-containing protein
MTRAIVSNFKRQLFASLTFTVLYLAGFHGWAQGIKFQHITSNDLSGFGNVWAVAEDVDGFLWFGTEDGLYKYDGYDITPYQHNPSDSGSISGNFVVSLFEDSHHNLWIGTYGDGLDLYDRSKNIFHHFRHDPKNNNSIPNDRVKTITETHDGTLWIGTEGGGIATLKTGTPIHVDNLNFRRPAPDSISAGSLFIRAIVEDKKTSVLYIATFDRGISIIDPVRKTIQNLRHEPGNPNSLASDKILELFLDSRNRLWIGTTDDGLDLYLPDQHTITHYPPANDLHSVCDQ